MPPHGQMPPHPSRFNLPYGGGGPPMMMAPPPAPTYVPPIPFPSEAELLSRPAPTVNCGQTRQRTLDTSDRRAWRV
jgi:hypothetical protein